MRKRILDTSVLIHYWRTHIKEQGLERATPADAEQWAQDLARLPGQCNRYPSGH